MNVGQLLDLINFISNKESSGNTMTPQQYNNMLPVVNLEFLKLKLGLPEEYVPGVTQPKQAWEVSQKITEDIKHLKVWMGGPGVMAMSIATNGTANYPSDMVYPSSIRYRKHTNVSCGEVTTKYYPVEILFDDQIGDRLGNSIKMPTIKNPVCVFYNTFIQFYPVSLRWVDFTYIRRPVDPVFGYTDVDDIPVYDAATSVELEYPEICHYDIAKLLLSKIGINLKAVEIVQYADMKQKQGV